MADFILFLSKIVTLYMYYVGFACLLSWVPNINPDYPLFHFVFMSTGFYLIPPFFGFIFAPLIIMVICVLISQGLDKLYLKLMKDKSPEIVVYTPEEFFQKLEQDKEFLKERNQEKETEKKDNNNDDGI